MNRTIAILILNLISISSILNGQTNSDSAILDALLTKYNVCISPDAIYLRNTKEAFPSILSAEFNMEEDLLSDSIKKILTNLSEIEIAEIKEKVLLLDKTYWFPNNLPRKCQLEKIAALSKPIYFKNSTRAIVITYRMVDPDSQDLIFLQKDLKTQKWTIEQSFLVGFYKTYKDP